MKYLLYGATALSAVAIASPAFAQSEEALAELAEEADSVIIVTAQRREQDLLDVPVAISTLGADALETQQINNVIDLNTAVPSVFSNNLSSPLSNSPVRIRGIGTGGGNPGFEGAVGMYVDEVFRSRAGAALTTFFDMEGVDILRGPQGTLFGKNTTAGAIVQRTAAPDLGDTNGYISGEYGNFDSYMVEGVVNLALGDTGAFRVSGLIDRTDGFFSDPFTGDPTADTQVDAIRAQVKLEPSDTFSLRIISDYSSWRTSGNYGRSTRIDNRDLDGRQSAVFGAAFALNPALGTGYWYWDVTDPANPGAAAPFDRLVSVRQEAEQDLRQFGITAHVDWEIGDGLNLRSITGYRHIDSDNLNGDWDFGPVDVGGRLDVVQKFDTFSQEFLLSGDISDSLEFVAGVNYFTEEIDQDRNLSIGNAFAAFFRGAPGSAPLGDTSVDIQDQTFVQNEDSYGVFGHLTAHLTDTIDLIGGVRWNRIEKSVAYRNNYASPEAYFDTIAGRVFGTLIIDAGLQSAFDYDLSRAESEFTYNVALQWRPVSEVQVYGSYSRGFKSGGFSLLGTAANGEPSLPTARGTNVVNGRTFAPLTLDTADFDPEFVDAYEIGLRWGFAPGSLLSLTGFYSDFTDLQVSVFNGLGFEVINAGSSVTKGIELEANFRATDTISFNVGGTYLDATYGDDSVGLPAGKRRGLAPELAMVAGVNFDAPVSDTIDIYANANVSYYSEMFLAEGGCEDAAGNDGSFDVCLANPLLPGNQLALEQQDAYATVNASLGLRAFENWDVSVFCGNCFDEEFFTYAFNQPFLSGGSPLGNVGAPRTYGVRLSKQF